MNFIKRLISATEAKIVADPIILLKKKAFVHDKIEEPSAEFLAAIPNLGRDHDKMVARAMELYSTDHQRIEWIKAIHHFRMKSDTGWVMDSGSKKPKWGITSSYVGKAA